MRAKIFLSIGIFIFLLCGMVALSHAQNKARPLITQFVDESRLVTLHGNRRPEANTANDRGAAGDDLRMEHMLLLLSRSPEQQQELEVLVENLHDSASSQYHRWLTAQEFGTQFGVGDEDRGVIKGWLESHGFTINVDYSNHLLIDFSGTAGQIREAFHTEIHKFDVDGTAHIANISDPQIPEALAPAIAGIVSLHDFKPHSMIRPRREYTVAEGGSTYDLVVPGDLAKIYNFNPLFSAGISGQGQTIALIEDSDVYTTDDWTSFRSVFGLTSYSSGSFSQIHPAPPNGTNNCSDPGATGNEREAIIDAEYASAAAPSATVVLASCASTTTFGGLIAVQNLLNESSAPPALMSISYGECEANNGAASNAFFYAAYEQAVTEGVSVFVAAGDNGAAECDVYNEEAEYGIGVNGWGSTPHNVSVGGTDYGDTYAGSNSIYWSSNNSSTYESALSYVPEIPWNDSCGSSLLGKFDGYNQTYGSSGFCNSSKGANYLNVDGGGGGPSGCATGAPSQLGVAGGTCAGWPKPQYQSVFGNPADGVRDLPDVSLFAATGLWLHYYPYCFSGPGGTACTSAPVDWPSAGGTSFAAPIMAGIQALVNQNAGARQGNPNYAYYSLAAVEYGSGGNTACNSTLGNKVGSSCTFHDVTRGDNDLVCIDTRAFGANNCYLPSGTFGVLSTSDTAYAPAFGATTGWDFATGIGTVNAYNLVHNWPTGFTLTANPSSIALTQGTQVSTTITVAPSSGFSGSVTFTATGLPNGVTASFSPNPATSTSTLTLSASSSAATGTVMLTIGGSSGTVTDTTVLSLTINPAQGFTLAASPTSLSVTQGSQGTSVISVAPVNGFSGNVTLTATGLPSGVTASFSPNPATSTSTLTLTASATAATGSATVTISGSAGGVTATTTISLTVSAAPSFTLAAAPSSVTVVPGSQGTSTISITPANGFSGSVTLSATGLPSGVTASFSPNPTTTTSSLTLTASATAAAGTWTITLNGVSGNQTATTTLSLTVNPAPGFTLAASPSSVTVVQGNQGTSTISITPLNGFSGSVTLSATGLPSGVTASFSPNPTTTSSSLTLTASATAAIGTSTITINGVSGSLTSTTTLSLTITGSASFSLAASPSSITVVQGNQASSTISITPVNGFNGSVTLTATGLPSGVTASFSSNPTTSTSKLTLKASTAAKTGTVTLTISGTSGGLTATTTIALTVNAAAQFKLSVAPSNVVALQGGQGTATVTITPTTSAGVTLSVAGLPSGVTASFSPNPATSASTLTVTVSSSAAVGRSSLTIDGTSADLASSVAVWLTVEQ